LPVENRETNHYNNAESNDEASSVESETHPSTSSISSISESAHAQSSISDTYAKQLLLQLQETNKSYQNIIVSQADQIKMLQNTINFLLPRAFSSENQSAISPIESNLMPDLTINDLGLELPPVHVQIKKA